MDLTKEKNISLYKPWKKVLCFILSMIIALGTFVTVTFGNSRFQKWLGIKSMLSAYAAEMVDTKGAIAVDEDAMLADDHTINLENRDGSNTVYLFSEPISYTDENGNLKTKDISVERADRKLKAQGYDYTNGQNDYRINFSKDYNKGVQAEFDDCSYSIIPLSNSDITGNETVAEYLNEKFEVFQYKNIYGEGTNLRFYPQLNGIKDEIILDNNIGKSYFSFRLETDNCIASMNEDGTVVLTNSDNEIIQTFSKPFAYDNAFVEGIYDEHYIDCQYSLEELSNGIYTLTVSVDEGWLESDNTVYPVVIDPTTGNLSYLEDAGIYSAKSANNYGSEQTCCFGRASEYGYGRVLNYFRMPTDIKKGAVINSAYSWQRETTGRTTYTKVTPYLIINGWYETSVTYANKPNFTKAVTMQSRTINSASTDDSNNPYWYKFNIAPAIKAWADGVHRNYGLMFISSEEDDKNYNWRAFASRSYSTSAMRPYYVINYTNDTTAPTVSSVTGNASNWTKGNVTLRVNGAADNSGGSGLHTSPYSFSTTQGSYNWQTDNSKTFSSNCTVYIYVRDALDNKRLVSTQVINKIDKTAPTTPTVTGNATEWTTQSVTLTASSSDGASGIKDYSFSTTQGVYSWQTDNTKSFDSNTTVYVYARDNAGNISSAQEVVIDKIDKQSPSTPIVSGNENWSNSSIELSVLSIDDLSGVAAYSFSTVQGSYSWQESNIITVDSNETIYICSKDNVGNISNEISINPHIDKIGPIGSVTTENQIDWVKQITLSATAEDNESGLSDACYSFSTSPDTYDWISANIKTIYNNGTYYISVKDSAGNISLLDVVEVNNIDSTVPEINNVIHIDNDNKTTITVDATDQYSGISQYSFDGGQTWQIENTYEFNKNSLNYVCIKVKDNLGNISDEYYYDIYTPQIYFENERLYIYNPNLECEDVDIYYNLEDEDCRPYWYDYTEPIILPENQDFIYVSFYMGEANDSLRRNFSEIYSNKFEYTEICTDLSLSYNGCEFDITRKWDSVNNRWDFSFSVISIREMVNGSIEVRLPDFETYTFIKIDNYHYKNIKHGYLLTLIYNDNGDIEEYVVSCKNINYHFNDDKQFYKISNAYCDLYNFEYLYTNNENFCRIIDGAGREVIINLNDDLLCESITDYQGGTILYEYNNNDLVCVIDQSNTTIGFYEYTNHNLTKSGFTTIVRDEENRIIRLENDNGFVKEYQYSINSNGNTVVTHTASDGSCISYEYNYLGMLLSSVDEYGDVTTYKYDSNFNKLLSIYKNGTQTNQYNYENDLLIRKFDNSHSIYEYYYYDSDNRIITIRKKDSCVHYVYNNSGSVVLVATVQKKYLSSYTGEQYDENYDHYDIVSYSYNTSGLISAENNGTTEVTNAYDQYGNAITTTQFTINDNNTTIVSTTNRTYNDLGNVTSVTSGDDVTCYVYDAAGRLLLTNANGKYSRTVYDNLGRVVQEIDDSDYIQEEDNIPNAYGNFEVGHRYVYSTTNNLISETNKYNQLITYEYSNVGTLYKKSFDIYDYYYTNDGRCDRIDINSETAVNYGYNIVDTKINTSEDRFVNSITYADGYVEKHLVDKYGNILSKYIDSNRFYQISSRNTNKNVLAYYDDYYKYYSTITKNNDNYKFEQEKKSSSLYFSYQVQNANDNVTINERHFGNSFCTIISENNSSYTSPVSNFDYAIEKDNTSVTELISNNNSAEENSNILSSTWMYNADSFVTEKSYNKNNLSYTMSLDENGMINSIDDRYFSYDALGELISTTGDINSSYTYDSRGNMTSKTVNGITTSYSYNNENWQDQLTEVNGNPLTYDANGNLLSYNGVRYRWSRGKLLSSVTTQKNSCSYMYDNNGYRLSKDVSGDITYFDVLNGKILAQHGTHNLYFQYNDEKPVGFILDNNQYYYITNIKGDIVGITDENGDLIASYTYDEWGKLLDIETAQAENETQYEIALLNPFRYRGYYYDEETGMYYLQSRYYDPDLCRFISADSFDYVKADNPLTVNAYIYCINNPLNYSDSTGHDLTWDVILDIIGTILLFDGISIDMLDIFGTEFTNSFFGLLGNVFGLVPITVKVLVEFIKGIPNDIWEIFEKEWDNNTSLSSIVWIFTSSFFNSILGCATEASLVEIMSTWVIGLLPAEMVMLLPGILLDDNLSSSNKFTLFFVDITAIGLSKLFTTIMSEFDFEPVTRTIINVSGFLFPIITDLISRIIMRKAE